MDYEEFVEKFINALPHGRALKFGLVSASRGQATLSMPYDENLVGDPDTGVVHGGAVFTLIDTAGGAAVLCRDEGLKGTATLDLRIDYMRSATPGQRIIAQADCFHATRTVAFIRAVAYDDAGTEDPIATASGAYTVAGATEFVK
ncbi:MAG: PaaI family thioesterase [Mangrovicoccus sp.]